MSKPVLVYIGGKWVMCRVGFRGSLIVPKEQKQ